MTGNLSELNRLLFAEMHRLADAADGDALDSAVTRAKAMADIADKVIGNTGRQLEAAKLFASHGAAVLPMLPQIGGPQDKNE